MEAAATGFQEAGNDSRAPWGWKSKERMCLEIISCLFRSQPPYWAGCGRFFFFSLLMKWWKTLLGAGWGGDWWSPVLCFIMRFSTAWHSCVSPGTVITVTDVRDIKSKHVNTNLPTPPCLEQSYPFRSLILLDNCLSAHFIFFFLMKTAYIFLEILVINLYKGGCWLFVTFT